MLIFKKKSSFLLKRPPCFEAFLFMGLGLGSSYLICGTILVLVPPREEPIQVQATRN
jgi:hypothetical protein